MGFAGIHNNAKIQLYTNIISVLTNYISVQLFRNNCKSLGGLPSCASCNQGRMADNLGHALAGMRFIKHCHACPVINKLSNV
jgi:hypothetical protein